MKSKIWSAVLSLLIAFAGWLYVITVVNPNSEAEYYNIPVVFTNESALADRGLMITSGKDATVDLRLSGNRQDLNLLNSSNITVQANLSGIYETGPARLTYSIFYPGDLPNTAFEVLSQTPQRLELTVERRLTKTIPVVVEYTGSLPDPGHYLCDKETPIVSDQTVEVTGPTSVVDLLEQAVIQIDTTDHTETFTDTYPITLCDAQGEPVSSELVRPSITEVDATLNIRMVKEVPLRLVVNPGGGATSETSAITIEPERIMVAGSAAVLEDLNEIVLGTIDLGTLNGQPRLELAITPPDGVENLSGTAMAQVSISFPNLLTKNFRVTDFIHQNLPEGLEAEIVTKELTVTVRGPKEVMERMKDTDMTAVLDLSNAQPGTYSARVNFVFGSGFEGVGVVSSYGYYSVAVTVRELNPDETGPEGG